MESLLGTSLEIRTMAVMSAVQGLGGRRALQGISNGLAYGGTMQRGWAAAGSGRTPQAAQPNTPCSKQMGRPPHGRRWTTAHADCPSPIRGIEANRASGITAHAQALGVVA